ncbi:hypothetical protein HY441_00590 [Candidatus Microgenomates bacterium]|nr:hypothetical protein [Candidatus Microgenomates bacterium]
MQKPDSTSEQNPASSDAELDEWTKKVAAAGDRRFAADQKRQAEQTPDVEERDDPHFETGYSRPPKSDEEAAAVYLPQAQAALEAARKRAAEARSFQKPKDSSERPPLKEQPSLGELRRQRGKNPNPDQPSDAA